LLETIETGTHAGSGVIFLAQWF